MHKILLFIPAYNCEKQLPRVLAKLTPSIAQQFAEILVVENRSTDGTLNAAKDALAKIEGCPVTLLQNDDNYSLGGSHKVAFNHCLEKNYDYLVVLHGDDQGDIADLLPYIANGTHTQYDCLLGSRFARESRLVGYSTFRTFGNIVFNIFISLVTRRWVTDMGAGLNMYSANFLRSQFYLPFPDNLTFNVYMLYYSIWKKSPFLFFPLTWREDDQVSNAKVFKQALHILSLTRQFTFNAKILFSGNHNAKQYTSQVMYRN